MKKFYSIVKTTAVFLFAGTLIFSCDFNKQDDYGFLKLTLPGSGSSARGIIEFDPNNYFLSNLRYTVICTGPGSVTREFSPGSVTPISLLPGTWTVKVEVWNAMDPNKETLGSEQITAAIEAGATTTESLTIPIDTSRCEIKSFVITRPIRAEGTIVNTEITVRVPYNIFDDSTSVVFYFTANHTGASIDPPSGFFPVNDPNNTNNESPPKVTVTAYNGLEQEYTVAVAVMDPPVTPPDGDSFKWYDDWAQIPWSNYGLSNMPSQPPGTVVGLADIFNEEYLEMLAILGGGDIEFFKQMMAEAMIEAMTSDMPPGSSGFIVMLLNEGNALQNLIQYIEAANFSNDTDETDDTVYVFTKTDSSVMYGVSISINDNEDGLFIGELLWMYAYRINL